jgi:adenosylcobinamide kinase/adenosylcobinamide-phosphate guanylyltransferase
MLTLILGGARSGKSLLAQKLAGTAARVTYIATLQPGDDEEMIARVAGHRASRPADWTTVVAPFDLADAVERAASDSDAVLVDCLTIWLSNLCWEHRDRPSRVLEITGDQLFRIEAASLPCNVLLVSNEVGSGIVPDSPVAREFRDAQGLLNQLAADIADEVILTVAGLPLYLKKAGE